MGNSTYFLWCTGMAVWEKLPDLAEPEKHILSLEILLFQQICCRKCSNKINWKTWKWIWIRCPLSCYNKLYSLLSIRFLICGDSFNISEMSGCQGDSSSSSSQRSSLGLNQIALCKSLQHEQGSKLTTKQNNKAPYDAFRNTGWWWWWKLQHAKDRGS